MANKKTGEAGGSDRVRRGGQSAKDEAFRKFSEISDRCLKDFNYAETLLNDNKTGLHRERLAKAAGIGKNTLFSNPLITNRENPSKGALYQLEEFLLTKGVIRPLDTVVGGPVDCSLESSSSSRMDKARIAKIELELASALYQIKKLESELEKRDVLKETLLENGRVCW